VKLDMTSCENEDVASRDEFIEKWKAISKFFSLLVEIIVSVK
jgi:hypothetical protein